jgi:hypothetical protein
LALEKGRLAVDPKHIHEGRHHHLTCKKT